MTKEVILLESVEQSIIYKALKDSKMLSDLASKILQGKPVPENHVVEILPEHKHPEIEKTSENKS